MSVTRKVDIADQTLKTGKEFAHAAMDLTDTEVGEAVKIINSARLRFATKKNTPENLDELRDIILTRLMEKNILATFDPAPCFRGEPPVIEIIGKITGDPQHKYGMDHEKKRHQVIAAKERGEDYYGQKEPTNAKTKAKRRSKNS